MISRRSSSKEPSMVDLDPMASRLQAFEGRMGRRLSGIEDQIKGLAQTLKELVIFVNGNLAPSTAHVSTASTVTRAAQDSDEVEVEVDQGDLDEEVQSRGEISDEDGLNWDSVDTEEKRGNVKTQKQDRIQEQQKEQLQRERLEKQRLEEERLAKEKKEQLQRLEKEKKEQLEKKRLEQEQKAKLERERQELERELQEKKAKLEREKLELKRREQEQLDEEKKVKLEQARLERIEQEKKEKLEQHYLEKKRLEQEKLEQDLLEQKRLQQDKQGGSKKVSSNDYFPDSDDEFEGPEDDGLDDYDTPLENQAGKQTAPPRRNSSDAVPASTDEASEEELFGFAEEEKDYQPEPQLPIASVVESSSSHVEMEVPVSLPLTATPQGEGRRRRQPRLPGVTEETAPTKSSSSTAPVPAKEVEPTAKVLHTSSPSPALTTSTTPLQEISMKKPKVLQTSSSSPALSSTTPPHEIPAKKQKASSTPLKMQSQDIATTKQKVDTSTPLFLSDEEMRWEWCQSGLTLDDWIESLPDEHYFHHRLEGMEVSEQSFPPAAQVRSKSLPPSQQERKGNTPPLNSGASLPRQKQPLRQTAVPGTHAERPLKIAKTIPTSPEATPEGLRSMGSPETTPEGLKQMEPKVDANEAASKAKQKKKDWYEKRFPTSNQGRGKGNGKGKNETAAPRKEIPQGFERPRRKSFEPLPGPRQQNPTQDASFSRAPRVDDILPGLG